MARGKTNELKEFIDYSFSRGASKEEVKNILLSSGWPKEVIDKMFLKTSFKIKNDNLSTGKSILRLANVSKSFGEKVVLDNISVSINPGEIFGIIGMTGSGKTTLLNTMIGFIEPDEGSIVVKSPKDSKDYTISKNHAIVSELFGFAAQHPSFYDKLSVEENVEHFASLYDIPKKQIADRCTYLIKMVGLWDARKVLAQNLSGGMQKRLDIACSMVHNPKILILDEPTADLDPVSREKMWEVLRQINLAGTTVILASHFIDELEELCTRFAIVHNRRILQIGTPDELKSDFSKSYEINLVTKSARYDALIKELKSKKGFEVHKIEVLGKTLSFHTSQPEKALYNLANIIDDMGEKIVDINVNRPTINELFESLVKA